MKKVFMVDDSATLLASMKGIAIKAGYAVDTAASAEIALQKLKGGYVPDLIITDLNMPGMNGIELIKEIRKLPAFRFKPILMLTTESQQSIRNDAKAAGAMGWLVKPVQAKQFVEVLKKVLP